MNDTLFWILSGTVMASSVVAVSHPNVRAAVVASVVLIMALAGLFIQLAAVWLAVTVVVVQGATVLVAALPVWFARIRKGEVEHATWRDVLWGIGLAVALVVEVAWMLQRLEAAPFVDRSGIAEGAADLRVADLIVPVMGVVFVLMSVAAVQALRREVR